VEFRQSSDRRTGKPVAVSVSKKPIVVAAPPPAEIINEKLVSGVVLAEAKVAAGINGVSCALHLPEISFGLDTLARN